MKTFDALYKERRKWLDENNIQDWTYLDTKWVAEEYASQAIDRYSEIHKLLTEAASPERSKDSIYSAANHFVKSELK